VFLAAPCNNNQGLIFFRVGDLCEDARALPADTAGNGDREIWGFWLKWMGALACNKQHASFNENRKPVLTLNSLRSRGDDETVFWDSTPYIPVDIIYVTEKSVSFHLKSGFRDVSTLMIEKDLPTCLLVARRHNLEFEQGNEYGDRTWAAAADTQTCFLRLKTFAYLRWIFPYRSTEFTESWVVSCRDYAKTKWNCH
jgi:hypothetical protein